MCLTARIWKELPDRGWNCVRVGKLPLPHPAAEGRQGIDSAAGGACGTESKRKKATALPSLFYCVAWSAGDAVFLAGQQSKFTASGCPVQTPLCTTAESLTSGADMSWLFFGEPPLFLGGSDLSFPQLVQPLHFIKGIPVCFHAFPSCPVMPPSPVRFPVRSQRRSCPDWP